MGRKKNTTKIPTNRYVGIDIELEKPPISLDSALSPSEYEGKAVTAVETISVSEIPASEIPVEDKVNNVEGKELAMSRAKVTRRRTYEVISELLSAVKKSVNYDSRGMEIVSEEPDLDRRKQGAELALKAFGDLKEMKSSEGSTTYNTVVYQWKKS